MTNHISIENVSTARRNGISAGLLRRRISRGWTMERATTQPVQQRKDKAEYDQWAAVAESNGIRRDTFRQRIVKRGWDFEKAATTPLFSRTPREVVDPNRKYILTDETMELDGVTLHRIQAIKSFTVGKYETWPLTIEKGDVGGWVENEYNLSHFGTCWVGEDAKVFGEARVKDNARVLGKAMVYGSAFIENYADVYGNAIICDFAEVSGSAKVSGDARVYGWADVEGRACVSENVEVYGHSLISGDASLYNKVQVRDKAIVRGEADIYGGVILSGIAQISTRGKLDGEYEVRQDNIFIAHNVGSENGTLTAVKDINGVIHVTRGCFSGTLDEFKTKLIRRHGTTTVKSANRYYWEYSLLIDFIKARFSIE